jgi:hypothetical protein
MSFVNATPEYVSAAATDLANIGSTISSANSAALGPTSSMLAPGSDEVSASIAALFGAHSQVYQALSIQAAAFHSQFVQLMNGGALQYAAAEAANVAPLQTVAAPASMGAQVPAAAAGLLGGSVSAAPAAPLTSAVASASAVAPAPAGAAVVAAPASATLTSAVAPAAPMRAATPAYSAATTAPATPAAPSTLSAPATEATPASTMPVSPGTPVVASPHSSAPAATAESSNRQGPPPVRIKVD